MSLRSSQDAINLIVQEEVTSEAVYTKSYTQPTWPGGMSGVTIGIGYDCGYSTSAQIDADWAPHVSVGMVEAMQEVAGITGSAAHSHAHELVGKVIIPWAAAMAVFMERDMPKWEGIVARSLPNTDKLHPDSFGALTSLAYNRGPTFSTPGARYAEMRSIHQHMVGSTFNLIPDDFRHMKHLWPNVLGLRLRRDREAALFYKGLVA